MAVEFISSPVPKICDQAGAQTHNPGIEFRFKKKTKKNRRNNECALLQVNCTCTMRYALYKLHVNPKYIY